MALIITGAKVLGDKTQDLYVDDAGLLVSEAPSGADVLDADGLVALPGLVDLHTHLRESGREDAETVQTGTLAAALGGFTAVHAMANTDPVADSVRSTITQQVANGVSVRMAVLYLLLGGAESAIGSPE